MCTIIFNWQPNTDQPFICGANRDEIPGRPSTGWAIRNQASILCPLDVRGGTWVGVNRSGLFCAIADRDDVPYTHGNYSRGAIATRALSGRTASQAVEWMTRLQGPYNGFYLILADRNSCYIVGYDGRFTVHEPDPGFHIVSGFGIDTWEVSRCKNITRMIGQELPMKQILSYHQTGLEDDDVCIHNSPENRLTLSSCIVRADKNWRFTVDAINTTPCSESEWNQFDIP
jgi:uncharacterized protein with NRDE domain